MTINNKKHQKQIESELRKMNFAGYGGDSAFLSYGEQQFQQFCRGELILSIGTNEFNLAVYNVTRWSVAREQYCQHKKILEKKIGIL